MAQALQPLKLLVANRSEIACRIFQTCKEMGILTVGIFTADDTEARHVTFADEVFEVRSYLDIPTILNVSKQANVKIIHPGYGFLSERPPFVKAVEENGLVFIGPRADTMLSLGNKTDAKTLAEGLGIPTLPWLVVSHQKPSESDLKKIGFPILIKAAAGGGGKGMRRVDKFTELGAAAESASAEALAAFGDGSLFLEKLVVNPRHIEVQVFGDGAGGGVHLYDRECTLQRRHQKILEEAPAPNISTKLRSQLYLASLKLVHATRYRNAGTIEFLVDPQENFYFLEMNTRLQVEHPVTEWITGLDLVRAQIQQALEPNTPVFTSSPPSLGHAIEVRIVAENPAQGFTPEAGVLEKIIWPMGHGIRVDKGIEEGQMIHTHYDSLLAKLIVHASNRENAIAKLKIALEETVILGIGTNQNYLRSLIDHPSVVAGNTHTGFLEKEFSMFAPELSPENQSLIQALLKATPSDFQPHSSSRNTRSTLSGRAFESASSNWPSPWKKQKDFPS